MGKTIAIVGAGGTMGLAVATRFGKEGFNVGLIARRQEGLDTLKAQLAEAGVTAVATATGDVTDDASLKAALDAIRAAFGAIDVIEFSPAYGPQNYRNANDTTYGNTMPAFELMVGGAIRTVTLARDDLVAQGGALLVVAGASALRPIPPLANIGIAMSGLRNYLGNLFGAFKAQGVYVGVIWVGGMIRKGTEVDPDDIAGKLYDMYLGREKPEEMVFGPPPPGAPGGPPPGGPGGPGGPPPGPPPQP